MCSKTQDKCQECQDNTQMPASSGFDLRLRSAMDAKSMSKKRLSDISRVGRTTIDEWLDGRLPVQQAPVQAVAEALGVSFDELWGENWRELRPDERLAYTQLRIFAKGVLQLIDELDIE